MPILKPENNMAPMPIYKPSDKVKYSLLIENPIKAEMIIPEKE
jgi:hypothetical protein